MHLLFILLLATVFVLSIGYMVYDEVRRGDIKRILFIVAAGFCVYFLYKSIGTGWRSIVKDSRLVHNRDYEFSDDFLKKPVAKPVVKPVAKPKASTSSTAKR